MSSKGKPARLQVDPESIPDDDKPPQTGHTFNIWYLKWAGGDSSSRNYVKLKFRVDVKRDSGYTKGIEHKSPICLFFARGCCYRGKKCPYIHRIPSEKDHRIPTKDCFGRDKTTDYRDDMSGVGLLTQTNRTLYVSGIHMSDQIEDILSSNFLEFGSIDKIKVLYGKGCAFVSYRLEAEAQFAKEAMDAQSLTGNDVLSVRWANDDPNPNAQEETKRLLEEAAIKTVKNLLSSKTLNKADNFVNEGPKIKSSKRKLAVAENERTIPESHTVSGLLDSTRLAALKKIKLSKPEPTYITPEVLKTGNTGVESSVSLLAGYSSDDD